MKLLKFVSILTIVFFQGSQLFSMVEIELKELKPKGYNSKIKFESLPADVISNIFKNLPFEDIKRLVAACPSIGVLNLDFYTATLSGDPEKIIKDIGFVNTYLTGVNLALKITPKRKTLSNVIRRAFGKTTQEQCDVLSLIENLARDENLSKRIVELHCEGFDLEVVPDGIESLTNLQVLNLSHNKLTFISNPFIPIGIVNLTNLRVLKLSYNELSNLPDSISNLVNLQTLYIGYNCIEEDKVHLIRHKVPQAMIWYTKYRRPVERSYPSDTSDIGYFWDY